MDFKAGIGGLYHNHLGICHLYFSTPTRSKSPLHSEFLACLSALTIVASSLRTNYWLETDSLSMVQILTYKNKQLILWYICNIYHKINHLRSKINIKITHAYRKTNKHADFLADLGSQDIFQLSCTPTRELGNLICGDLSHTFC